MKTTENFSATSNGALTTESFQDMHHNWMTCPRLDIPDLFYFSDKNGLQNRVYGFTMEKHDLDTMFGALEHAPDINLRFYLAAKSVVSANSDPAFIPIIQGFDALHVPNSINENSFLPTGTIYGASDNITQEEAEEMISTWQDYYKPSLPDLFESNLGRIRYTTFSIEDSNNIRSFCKNLENCDLSLKIFLGFEFPREKEPNKPFGFRIVLEVSALPSSGLTFTEFYEFSNPCPPLC